MSDPRSLYNFSDLSSTHTAVDSYDISPSNNALPRPVRWIRAEGAGTINVTTFAGVTRTLRFKDGETRFVGATHVTSKSGVVSIEGMV
jgi:hypothetical protein